jgi:TolB-like protein/Tfp pilus assembly protein PilF/tRNA A-37 threonylcarbamoyl transferase component Bud32
MADPEVGDALVGQTLGHYRIIDKIGAGGMGEVYRAHDEHLDREVAIKVLPPGMLVDESSRKRFHKEALALSRLNHPNIATIHDFDTEGGVDFLVMEYIPGITLSAEVANRPLSEAMVISLGTQLAEGLAAAHEQGVIHRDLKPGNLRLTRDGRLKILDFGLAKLRQPVASSAETENLTETQTMTGTLPYMAPEQLLGEGSDARTDIHAAGAVLYEMGTGQRSFADVERSQVIAAILRKPPRPPRDINPRVSPELERIILKCMDKHPPDRYQSAIELAVDLRRLGGSGSISIPAAGRQRFAWRRAAGAVAIAMLLGAAVMVWRGWWQKGLTAGSRPHIRSLAVLPLENTSHNPEQDYFADGMTDELINDLGNIGALRVISRTSSMRFKGSRKSLPEIARMLNVDAVVEGSVMLAGDRVRIITQLVYAPNDRDLWTQRYEGDLRDVLGLQREVASAIANQIKVKLTQQEHTRLQEAPQVNADAYQAYLKGRYHWNRRDRASLEKSIRYFQDVIAEDPNYALGYAGLADVYVLLGADWSISTREANERAKAAAKKALEIDDGLAEAHASLAGVYHNEWNWQAAENEFQKAIDLNPSYATAHHWYSIYLSTVGRFDESVKEARKAIELDPLSLMINANLGTRLGEARRYDEAADQCRKTVDMDPNFGPGYFCLGLSSVQRGRLKEGARELQKALELFPGNPLFLGQLGVAYGLSGEKRLAGEVLEKLKEPTHSALPHYCIAMVYASLGDKQQAIASLSKAYDQGSVDLINLKIDPVFAPIRSDVRVQDLMRRMRFPQ